MHKRLAEVLVGYSTEVKEGDSVAEIGRRLAACGVNVPSATMQVAKKCSLSDTRFQPNSITPRKPASMKKAVNTS